MSDRIICAAKGAERGYFCFTDMRTSEFWEDPYQATQRLKTYDESYAGAWATADIHLPLVAICRYTYPDRDRTIFVGLSPDGDAAFLGREEGFSERIQGAGLDAQDSRGYGTMNAIRQIGKRLYAAGGGGQIYRREGTNDWHPIDEGVRIAEAEKGKVNRKLSAIDGLHENEIYVAGIHGIIWCYDGTRWHRVESSTAEWLTAITIEDEDTVWICGQNGTLLKGNARDGFHDVSGLGDSDSFLSIAVFENCVYLAREGGLSVFDGKTIQPVETGLKPAMRDGQLLDAVDGVLWSFGFHDIARFDGNEWKRFPTGPI